MSASFIGESGNPYVLQRNEVQTTSGTVPVVVPALELQLRYPWGVDYQMRDGVTRSPIVMMRHPSLAEFLRLRSFHQAMKL